jgi:hypothetical protein
MINTLRYFRLVLQAIFFIVIATSAHAQSIELRTERGGISNDGRVKLIWGSTGDNYQYLIQQATDSEFNQVKVIYEGPDRASFVSGLKTGTYYYRVKTKQGHWSETLVVEVKHHSLSLALSLFGMGALVFLLTVLVVVRGSNLKSIPTS